MSGVVNFVTKRDFSGVEVNISDQITERGDGNQFRVDLTVGANFDDGRGNVALSIGYQKSDPVYQGDRPYSVDNIFSEDGSAGGSGTTVPTRFTGARPVIAGTTTPNTNPTVNNLGLTVINPTTGVIGGHLRHSTSIRSIFSRHPTIALISSVPPAMKSRMALKSIRKHSSPRTASRRLSPQAVFSTLQ
ncbi:hypothetical protein [Hankyongella ginsenosidimutans]|uniref:hypothetical protein n=1 Tax=Hankyongella ginsenosidimutans TaxID=1763828 RepID=UPI001FE8382D|nr:hypothetical protein [Hankyongella ginsenosidimutans]